MNYNKILLRTGEIFLKGKNRHFFENKLVDNIKKIVGKKPKKLRFRYFLDYFPEHYQIKKIFGITSYSPAVEISKDIEEIKKEALILMKNKQGTFKVESKRADKSFFLTSPELSKEIGGYLADNTSLIFSLINPENILYIEIGTDKAYIYDNVVSCFGGIPTETEGKVLSLIDNHESYLSSLLLMKRGCKIYPVSLKEQDINLLNQYSPTILKLNKFNTFQDIEDFAQKNKINVIVTSNNFDQKLETDLVELKPLISLNKEEIKQKLLLFNSK